MPKPLLALGSSPLLFHLMMSFAEQGVRRFILAAGYRSDRVKDFARRLPPEWEVVVVDSGVGADTGERARSCSGLLTGTALVTYGDGLANVKLHDLLSTHERAGKYATVTVVPLRLSFGLVRIGEDGLVDQFQEKPVLSEMKVNGGFIVMEPAALDETVGTSLERDILPDLAGRGELAAYVHSGFWHSVDTAKDLQHLESLYLSATEGRRPVPWSTIERGLEPGHRFADPA